jgi:hypothetical protein
VREVTISVSCTPAMNLLVRSRQLAAPVQQDANSGACSSSKRPWALTIDLVEILRILVKSR